MRLSIHHRGGLLVYGEEGFLGEKVYNKFLFVRDKGGEGSLYREKGGSWEKKFITSSCLLGGKGGGVLERKSL